MNGTEAIQLIKSNHSIEILLILAKAYEDGIDATVDDFKNLDREHSKIYLIRLQDLINAGLIKYSRERADSTYLTDKGHRVVGIIRDLIDAMVGE